MAHFEGCSCRKSSKRVQTGEPPEISVSILYSTGDPNSTPELVAFRGVAQHLFVSELDVNRDRLQAHGSDSTRRLRRTFGTKPLHVTGYWGLPQLPPEVIPKILQQVVEVSPALGFPLL